MTANSFGSRATLEAGGAHARDLPPGRGPRQREPPVQPEGAAREPAPQRGRGQHHQGAHQRPGQLGPEGGAGHRDPVHPGPGDPAGPDRRARRRRPRRHARGDAGARRRPDQDQPAHPRRAGHRPLGGRRRLRPPGGVRPERGARVPAQPRALPVPALGPGRLRRLPRRPAGHRHRAPGQHRAPGPRGHDGWRRTRAESAGVPGHLRRHRQPHHHGERPRHPRLGRRRHRGGGGHARPAHLHADPEGRRLPPHRPAPAGDDRHRPGAHDHRDTPQARRGRQVRRVPRRRRRPGPGGQPGDDRQHVAGVRLHLRDLPDRRRDDRLPAADRPSRGPARPGGGVRQGAGPVARPGPRAALLRGAHPRPVHRRPVHRRPEAPAGPDRAGQRQDRVPRRAAGLHRRRRQRLVPRVRPGRDRGHPRRPTRSRSPSRTAPRRRSTTATSSSPRSPPARTPPTRT